MQAVLSASDHPTAEWVFHEARKALPRISLGTVYRILGSLAESGRVRVIASPSGPRRYDPTVRAHAHIVCSRCGVVTDVPFREYEHTRHRIQGATRYVIEDCEMRWTGICPGCQSAQPLPSQTTEEE